MLLSHNPQIGGSITTDGIDVQMEGSLNTGLGFQINDHRLIDIQRAV